MKKILTLLAAIFILWGHSKGQTWQWARHCGGINSDGAGPICIDTADNIYFSGRFFNPMGIFGNDSIGTSGLYDVFVSKLDKNGNFIWTKRAGGYNPSGGNESAWDLVYETSSSSIIVAGSMNGSNKQIDSCSLGGNDIIFLSKMDLNGNCIWAVEQGDLGAPTLISIALDHDGFIYMTGRTIYQSYFNTSINLAPCNFLAKFNSIDGSLIWVKNIVNVNGYIEKIIYDNDSLIISGGSGIDSLVIDSITIICQNRDGFISKFDTTGKLVWFKIFGGSKSDGVLSAGTDSTGNIYVSGVFQDTANFDSEVLMNGNNKDVFIAKYDRSGDIVWTGQTHITGNNVIGGRLKVEDNGDVNVIGTFNGNATFGNSTITAITASDIFITRYNSNGTCYGVIQVGNSNIGSIATNSFSQIILSGSFTDTANFDSQPIVSYGSDDAFIAKHDAISGEQEERKANNTLTIYANPTAGKCNITVPDDFAHEKNLTLNIYDNTGKLIQQKKLEMNEGKIKLNLEAEAKGIYNVTLSNGKKSYGGKIIFE